MRKLRFRGIEYLTKSYPTNIRQIKDLKPGLSAIMGVIFSRMAGWQSSVNSQMKNSPRLEAMLIIQLLASVA